MTRQDQSASNDGGAILIHVAFGLLAITALSTFVVDYGVYWQSRRQIQNAADAGALAGVIALAYENTTDLTPTGPAALAAVQAATSNMVWGAAPSVVAAGDVTLLSGTGVCPPPNVDGTCARVDAYRTVARDNPLPIFFGSLVGLTAQDVQATATALMRPANASNCIKPMAVADKWVENVPVPGAPWTPTQIYGAGDTYVAPSLASPGSSFTIAGDFGIEILLKTRQSTDTSINAGWFQPVREIGASGPAAYLAALSGCIDATIGIGDVLVREDVVAPADTVQGVTDLIAFDPTATWNASTQRIDTSCVETAACAGNPGARQSPRVMVVPVFDLAHYLATGGISDGEVRIVNFLALFVVGLVGDDVRAVIIKAPGQFDEEADRVADQWAFLKTTALVR